MKKKNTLIKLFSVLAVCALGTGNVWADEHTIMFDRITTSYKDMPFDKTTLNCTSRPVPDGSTWTPSGSAFTHPSGTYIEHDWGYYAITCAFNITLGNFKYYVTKILLSADGGAFTQGTGTLTMTSYDNKKTGTITVDPDFSIFIVSDGYEDSKTTYDGLTSISYQQTGAGWVFFNSSNFLQVTYQDPQIAIKKSQVLGVGSSYSLTDDDITWTYQGAFSASDIRYSSSNEDVVDVSDDGKTLTAGSGTGTATITAWIDNGAGGAVANSTITYDVTVVDVTVENGKATATGTWTKSALEAALANKMTSTTTSVDLTDATITDGSVTVPTTNNPNVLIKASSSDQVSNTYNVLYPDATDNTKLVCNKLKIADGNRFSVAEAFTANETEYSRTGTSTWGTVCLPYAPIPTETTNYYVLQSAGENSLTFAKVTTPQANTPYLFKNTSGNSYNASYTDDRDVIVTPAKFETQTDNYYLRGVFNPTSIIDGTNSKYTKAKDGYDLITDPNAYYFTNNQFSIINGRMNMAGFRSYLTTTTAGAKAAAINISFIDDDTNGVKFIENEDNGTVEVIYDINGRHLNAPHQGINIVNGKKVLVK